MLPTPLMQASSSSTSTCLRTTLWRGQTYVQITVSDDAYFLVPMVAYEMLMSSGCDEPHATLVTNQAGLPLPADQLLSSPTYLLTPEADRFLQPILFFMWVSCHADHVWRTVDDEWQEVPIVYNESGWIGAELDHFCSVCASIDVEQPIQIKLVAAHLENFDTQQCKLGTTNTPVAHLDVFIYREKCRQRESDIAKRATRQDKFEYVRITSLDLSLGNGKHKHKLELSVGVGETNKKEIFLDFNSFPVRRFFEVALPDLPRRTDGTGYDLPVSWMLNGCPQKDKCRLQFHGVLQRYLPAFTANKDGKIVSVTFTASASNWRDRQLSLANLLIQDQRQLQAGASKTGL